MEDEKVYEFKIRPAFERYYNEDSAYGVYNFSTKDDIPHYSEYKDNFGDVEDIQKMSSLVGNMQRLYLGSEYLVKATVTYSKKFNSYQYKPISVTSMTPKSYEAQLIFLQSMTNATAAKNLLAEYPDIVKEVINGRKNIDVSKVSGVGEKTWNKIRDGIIENYVVSDIIVMLQPLGVTYNMIKKLLSKESNPALLKQKLDENPYIMTSIRGLGFKRVDDLALKIKPELRSSNYRLASFIHYTLTQLAEGDGHTWTTVEELTNQVSDNVPECLELLQHLLDNNTFLYQEGEHIGLKHMRNIEKKIFDILMYKMSLDNQKFNFSDDEIDTAIHQAEDSQGFKYTDEQVEVIRAALRNDVAIISGKAGCVDCDTEFFDGTGWKKISEWQKGDKVLQYNRDGSAKLVQPLAYIKQEKDYLWHFSNGGTDQCLSEDHMCAFRYNTDLSLGEMKFGDIMKRHFKGGKICTSFYFNGKDNNMEGKDEFEYYVDEQLYATKLGFLLPNEWYTYSNDKLKIIAECIDRRGGFFTTLHKQNADLIQFVYTAVGQNAEISYRGSNFYTVKRTYNNLVPFTNDDGSDLVYEKYKTLDGYEYCFEVPSHMLILRRNDKIFITKNCGKSSISRAFLQAYKNRNYSISAMALSAKAAQRISEATGLVATTIHRGLGAKGLNEFEFCYENPLPVDVVLIDEASMINARLFYDVLIALSEGTRIIIMGDNQQLPPIGYGNIFSDILNRPDLFNSHELKTVMRQAQESGILSDANMIREGINPVGHPELKLVHGKLQDMYYLFRENREALRDIAIKTYMSSIKTDGLDEVVIITPRRENCYNSSFEINKIIEEQLFGKEEKSITYGLKTFHLGSKVAQTVNDYKRHVFNGETGYITGMWEDINENGKKEWMCEVTIKDLGSGRDKKINYTKSEMGQLDLAYAGTVHRNQGSGFKTVIGIVDNQHYSLLDSCMLYTLLTRAKKRCCLLAEPAAFLTCIRNNKNIARQTWLKDFDEIDADQYAPPAFHHSQED